MSVVSGRHVPTPQGHPGNNNSSSVVETDHLHNGAQMVALTIAAHTIICDEVSDVLTYVGYAAPGSDTEEGRADARWRIAQLTPTGIRWAYVTDPNDGTIYAGRPQHVWNNRADFDYA